MIQITARRFAFTPAQITVKKGETIRLQLTSEDVTHGFFMETPKIKEVISPGKVTEVMITPETAGTFTVICDHVCGVDHSDMKMTIVVE